MSLVSNSQSLRALLKEIFPPTRLTLLYGSAAFAQTGRTKGKMLDIIFAVDDTMDWHSQNMSANPTHYSFVRRLPRSFLAGLQRSAAGIYYNPFIELQGCDSMVKYGVIASAELRRDLQEWSTLYVSGRMHKPVLLLETSPELDIASRHNLSHAVRTALLLLPETFSLRELFSRITGISYTGDIRMGFAEDANKTNNIVNANYTGFEKLYRSNLNVGFKACVHINGDILTQDKSNDCTKKHICDLPANLLTRLAYSLGRNDRYNWTLSLEDFMNVLEDAKLADLSEQVTDSLEEIIAGTSVSQSAKGILTAGLWKSAVYSFEKIKKGAGISK